MLSLLKNIWVGREPQSLNRIGLSNTRTKFSFLRHEKRSGGQLDSEEISQLFELFLSECIVELFQRKVEML